MFKWKLEDMALLNEKDEMFLGKEKIYSCEKSVSREDKITFIDSLHNGKLSYLLNLIEKFNKEKESLPKDKYGFIKTVSLKAWINRNDKKYGRPIIDNWYQYGSYNIIGVRRWITNNNKGHYDTYENLVDEVFHRQLKLLKEQEYEYFLEHDEYSILKEKFRNKNYNTTFGVNIAMCSNDEIYVFEDDHSIYDKDNYYRKITIEELKYLLSKYEEFPDIDAHNLKESYPLLLPNDTPVHYDRIKWYSLYRLSSSLLKIPYISLKDLNFSFD